METIVFVVAVIGAAGRARLCYFCREASPDTRSLTHTHSGGRAGREDAAVFSGNIYISIITDKPLPPQMLSSGGSDDGGIEGPEKTRRLGCFSGRQGLVSTVNLSSGS
ncbi:hypothetical protein FQA47_003690 [Oryzias melastigma]|uniref:Uncharacterized protein n=1 Tax=Oryzias melastigma TaxID=30732 RepID=A0A834FLN0_ORYME|nr:hypothetical protein FQA47_003690 [Oryzias melastigma]